MRHRASRPLIDFWHRLPRTAAGLVGKAASDRSVRALAALMVALGLATGGYVIVASSVGESTPQAQPVDPTAPDEAIDQYPTGETLAGSAGPTPPSSSPDPDTSAAGKPAPSRSTTATQAPNPLPRPLAGQVTGLPDSTTATPSTSPSQQSPTPSTSPEDSTPPQTSLSEEFPAVDAALFTFSANEPASFTCSIDGAAYTSCQSPTLSSNVDPGWHTFAVRATDAAGNTDPSPAETRWHARGSSSDQ
jgi:hypothetical protein